MAAVRSAKHKVSKSKGLVSKSKSPVSKGPSVTVYSTPTCPWCVRVKSFLKENNIKFTDIDVAKDHKKADEMVEKSGQMGVPVIMIDNEIVVGFDQDKLKRLLKLK